MHRHTHAQTYTYTHAHVDTHTVGEQRVRDLHIRHRHNQYISKINNKEQKTVRPERLRPSRNRR